MLKNLWNKLVELFNKNKEELKDKAVDAVKGWTAQEVHKLTEMVTSEATKEEMAKVLDRSITAINCKLTKIFGTCKIDKINKG